MSPRLPCAALALGLWLTAAPGRAQPLPPLTDSNFNLDLFQGPVLGSTRVVGLAGAYSAVAEESVGIPFNPASVAQRTHYSRERFDWDAGLDFLLPGLFQGADFDYAQNGRTAAVDSVAWSFGGQIQYKSFGVGVYARGQTYQLDQVGASEGRYAFGLWLVQLAVGYALFEHQLVVGGGPRLGLFEVTREPGSVSEGQGEQLLEQVALGGEVGLLWRPRKLPVRVAAAFSSPLRSETSKECDELCPDNFFMPQGVALPWEVRLGVAYRLGGGAFNPTPRFPAKQPQRAASAGAGKPVGTHSASSTQPATQPASAPASRPGHRSPTAARSARRGRRYLLVAAQVDLTGSVDRAIGSDGFVEQVREPSGEQLSVALRLGVESEVWPRRLRLRVGSYWEPSRFRGISGRLHGAVAFDLRLFDFTLWGPRSLRFSSAVDLARRYSNLMLSLGFWH